MTLRTGILASLGIAAIAAAILLWMGRVPICTCGEIKLWHGEIMSSENSQHLADWYSPSHLLHGLIFYAVLWLILGRYSIGLRLAIATLIEVAWEVAENTDAVIQHYREATIALDYFGDSVLNSMSDTAFMWLGFLLAARLPVWVSIAIFIAAELIVGYFIRDGLTLNVIMLLAPQDWIKDWQAVLWTP
ncbi:UNVERIFIED_CONTAM: hypothetical protein GTU68_025677 [Idotea baltica]|nr:hypothetical protein [Idotea baltica]